MANETNVDITFFDVITNERWRKAMKEEMEAISKNHTWMLVKLPQSHKQCLIKWIFKIKEDQHKQTKYKACLAAWDASKNQNRLQRFFFLVEKWTTIKLVTIIVNVQGWELHHMDIKSPFLNEKIEQESYL